ncbi:MAG TPA: LCP family protein [Bacillota bacterium]|jgi:LCP family protein required for cell wall assembly
MPGDIPPVTTEWTRAPDLGPRRSKKKIRIKWGRIALVAAAALAIFLVILGSSVYSFLRGIHTDLTRLTEGRNGVPAPLPGQRVNILVLGLDTPQDTTGFGVNQDLRFAKLPRRTDTMVLFSFDPENHALSMISVPRDTEVVLPTSNGHIVKINQAHADGDLIAAQTAKDKQLKDYPNSVGPEMAMDAVSKLLGVPVHYYVRTDVQGFVKLVDILGGVEMDVPQDMDYDDPYQDLHIHLKKGPQLLNGEKAMELVRFRHGYAEGDIKRVQVQQEFFKAVMKKALTVGTVFKIPALAGEASKWIDTNLRPSDILSLATQGMRLDGAKVKTGTVPVTDEWIGDVSYVKADPAGTRRLVDELIRGIDRTANAKIKVQVLNGSGTSGLGSTLAEKLRDLGFNVANVGTADKTDYANTQVIGLDGDDDNKVVGKAVSGFITTARLYQRKEKNPQFDVTVIVGKDYPH